MALNMEHPNQLSSLHSTSPWGLLMVLFEDWSCWGSLYVYEVFSDLAARLDF